MKRSGVVLMAVALACPACALAAEAESAETIRVDATPARGVETSGEGGGPTVKAAEQGKSGDSVPEQAQAPATLTITTGGGNKIGDRVVALFGKTVWRLYYPDAPAIEKAANQILAADGYNVEKMTDRNGWYVQTLAIGDPVQYAPPGDGNEETKAGFERGARTIAGMALGILTGGVIFGGNIAGGPTVNNPNAKYITKDMVNSVPPGAKKILLTRVVSPIYRSQQEVLTVAYSDVSDEELRRINAGPLLEMLGLKSQPGEKHVQNSTLDDSSNRNLSGGVR